MAPDQWLLKGGFALELRLAGRARATKDVDIDWQADEELLLETLIDAAVHDAGDYFTFTVERTGAPEDRLGGSGFRRDEEVTADTLTTEALLAFAEIPPVEVLAVPLELQVAEKLHAYTRTRQPDRGTGVARAGVQGEHTCCVAPCIRRRHAHRRAISTRLPRRVAAG